MIRSPRITLTNKDDADHLIQSLKEKYKISIDWKGRLYCGITLTWDYLNIIATLSIPGYVAKCLSRFKHKWKKMQDAPHPWNTPAYGAHKQYATNDNSPHLDDEMKTFIQQVIGSFLFYGRAVDPTILTTLNSIAKHQATPIEETKKNIDHFLDYCATHPEASICYHKSDMQLWCDSDAAYLVAKNARSRIAGHFYISDKVIDLKKKNQIRNRMVRSTPMVYSSR